MVPVCRLASTGLMTRLDTACTTSVDSVVVEVTLRLHFSQTSLSAHTTSPKQQQQQQQHNIVPVLHGQETFQLKTSCSLGSSAVLGFRPRRWWTMNEVTATAACDMFGAEQENNTMPFKLTYFLVCVVQHRATACPARKIATLLTLPTTQMIYRKTSSEKASRKVELTGVEITQSNTRNKPKEKKRRGDSPGIHRVIKESNCLSGEASRIDAQTGGQQDWLTDSLYCSRSLVAVKSPWTSRQVLQLQLHWHHKDGDR